MAWYWWVISSVVALHTYIALGGLTIIALRHFVGATAVPKNDVGCVVAFWPAVLLLELLVGWGRNMGRIGAWFVRDRSPKVPKAKTVKR